MRPEPRASRVPRLRALLLRGAAAGCSVWVLLGCQANDAAPGYWRYAASPSPRELAPFAGDAAISLSTAEHALLISIDGLGGSYVAQRLAQGGLPHLAALRSWGASTTEARTDFTYTKTLPDHTSMFTGRPVSPIDGLPADVNHGYYADDMPGPEATLHNSGNPNLSYVASIFDVAHDHGLRTCFYAGKAKFILYARSYDAQHGAPDTVGLDDGRGKIDRWMILESQSSDLSPAQPRTWRRVSVTWPSCTLPMWTSAGIRTDGVRQLVADPRRGRRVGAPIGAAGCAGARVALGSGAHGRSRWPRHDSR